MKKKKQYLSHAIALLLALALFTQLVPSQLFTVFAQENQSAEAAQNEEETDSENPPEILEEITEKREEGVKHFALSNGDTLAVQYAIPVHFRDSSGQWQEYDNRLIENTRAAAGEPELSNQSSDHLIGLSKKAKQNNMVTVKADGFPISWGFAGIQGSPVELTENKESRTGEERFTTLPNVLSEAWYRNVYREVDLQYYLLPGGVKENIILRSAKAQHYFEITYDITGLTAQQTDERTIELVNKDGKSVYTIHAPVMTDAQGQSSNAVALKILKRSGNQLTLSLTADRQWLDDSTRCYPVTVDPDITLSQSLDSVHTAFLSEGQPTKCYGKGGANYEGSLYVGYESAGSRGRVRSLLKVNELPSLSTGDKVVSAQIGLCLRSCSTTMEIDLYEVIKDWTMSTVNWDNMITKGGAAYDSTRVIDYVPEGINNGLVLHVWDITTLAKGWYEGKANKGMMLVSPAENTQAGRAWYFSGSYPASNNVLPVFRLTYRNMTGLNDYNSYKTYDFGYSGTLSLNEYTGGITHTFQDVSYGGSLLNTNIYHVYNTRLLLVGLKMVLVRR